MTAQLINNPYNQKYEFADGQGLSVGHIELWQGEILPENYTWYGLGQEALRDEYMPLYKHVVKYNKITTEENWQAGLHGLFSDGDGKTTFRFPLLQDGDVISFSDGVTTPVGQKINEELPNINGSIRDLMFGGTTTNSSAQTYPTEAFIYWGNGRGNRSFSASGGSGASIGNYGLQFKASKSNPIYKDGGHVKQSGVAARLIIKYK